MAAQARQEIPGWKVAGDWSIRIGSGDDKGCFAITSTVRDNASFTLGYNRYGKNFVLMAADKSWNIQANKSYGVRLKFDKSPPFDLRMQGNRETSDATLIWEGNEVQALLRGLGENEWLHLELDGKRVASFRLNGIDQVLKSVLACRDTMAGQPAAPQPGTQSAREGESGRITRWKDVGGWKVDFDPGMPGCVARTEVGTNELRFGTTGEGPFYVALRDKGWSWIKNGGDYAVEFMADGKTVAPLTLMGVNRSDLSRPALLEEVSRTELDDLIARLARAQSVTARLGERQLGRYSTSDLAAAIREMHECNRANTRADAEHDDAKKPKFWKAAGAWMVFSQPSTCMAAKEIPDPGNTDIMVARKRDGNTHAIVLVNPDWNWIEQGANYEVILHFDPAGRVEMRAVGAFDSGEALALEGSADLFDSLRTQRGFSLEYKGRRIGAVTLPDFEILARELRACIDTPFAQVGPSRKR